MVPAVPPLRGFAPILQLFVLMLPPVLAACAEAPAAHSSGQRIILALRAPAADGAAIALIRQAGATDVRPQGAISERSAAYQIRCPDTDASCDGVIARLRRQPQVDYVQPDRIKEIP